MISGKVWMAFASAAVVVAAVAQAQDYVDECPEPNGFYADAVQCDRYYECKNGEVRVRNFLLRVFSQDVHA